MPLAPDPKPATVVIISEARKRLRPPESGSLAATLKNIEDVFAKREDKSNG